MNRFPTEKSFPEYIFDAADAVRKDPSFLNNFSLNLKEILTKVIETEKDRDVAPMSITFAQKRSMDEDDLYFIASESNNYVVSEEEMREMENVMNRRNRFDITKYNVEIFRLMKSGIFQPRACL